MTKVKVSKGVAEFIKSYENNVNSYNGWENHLLMEHCRAFFNNYEGCREEALVMKDIEPIQLAEILVNGYVYDKYDKEDLKEYFKVLNTVSNQIYTVIKQRSNKWVVLWSGAKDEIKTEAHSTISLLTLLNEKSWEII